MRFTSRESHGQSVLSVRQAHKHLHAHHLRFGLTWWSRVLYLILLSRGHVINTYSKERIDICLIIIIRSKRILYNLRSQNL